MLIPTRILGLMSGSSLDGLDIGCVEFDGTYPDISYSLLGTQTYPFSDILKSKFINISTASAEDLVKLDAEYSTFVSECVKSFLSNQNQKVHYIASHGHTVYHASSWYTYQIGNGGYLAGKIGIDVISDFRTTDISRGGTGAPFAPIVERDLFKGHDFYINFGGICNITAMHKNRIFAYDVCPCNQLLNYLAQQADMDYDKDGKLASEGEVSKELYRELSQIPYYNSPYPKSIDNSWLQKTFFPIVDKYTISTSDKLNTICHHISDLLCDNIVALRPHNNNKTESVFISGGGAFNTYLINIFRSKLENNNIQLIVPDKRTIDYKEVILMAYMGYLRISKKFNVIPSVTGASQPSIGGAIYLGR